MGNKEKRVSNFFGLSEEIFFWQKINNKNVSRAINNLKNIRPLHAPLGASRKLLLQSEAVE